MEQHELVDRNGNKTGKVLTHVEARYADNIPEGYYISVVGVVIINEKNEILLQKRSRFKRTNPSKWGICGGKVDLGEDTIDTAIRETEEEIGVHLNPDDLRFLCTSQNENAYFTRYYIKKNIDLSECILQKEEVEYLKYFKLEDLKYLNNEGFDWLESLKKVMEE